MWMWMFRLRVLRGEWVLGHAATKGTFRAEAAECNSSSATANGQTGPGSRPAGAGIDLGIGPDCKNGTKKLVMGGLDGEIKECSLAQ